MVAHAEPERERITVQEASERYRIPPTTLYRWIYKGRRGVFLKVEREAHRVYLNPDVLDQFIHRTRGH